MSKIIKGLDHASDQVKKYDTAVVRKACIYTAAITSVVVFAICKFNL